MRTTRTLHEDDAVDRAEVVRLDLLPGVTVELMRTWYQRQVFPKHSHDYFTVALGLRGAGVVWFRGADHLRRRGEIVVIPPDEVHTGQPAPGASVLSYLAAHVPPSVLALCADAHDVDASRVLDIAPAIVRDPVIGDAFLRLDDAMTAAVDAAATGQSRTPFALVEGTATEAVIEALGSLVRRHAPDDPRATDQDDRPDDRRLRRQRNLGA
jgi:hypothetical protein